MIGALVEGDSIRSVVRMTGIAENSVARLLVEAGAVCAESLARAEQYSEQNGWYGPTR